VQIEVALTDGTDLKT
jgi:L-iditol 2-dehydrogenase